MARKLNFFLALGLICALPGVRLTADTSDNAEAKLRETVRSTMIQLQDAQNQLAVLQAAQADRDQQAKTLAAQNEALKKQCLADRTAADKTIVDLNAKSSDQAAQLARLQDSLAKWKIAYNQMTDLARAKNAQRAELASANILLKRQVADVEAKNAALFKLGNEILTRYEKFSLGEALAAKEPFVGVTRVRLENLVQSYEDKLADQKLNP